MASDPSERVLNSGSKIGEEKVDERILRILNLSSTFSLDYQTYYNLLNKKIRTAKITGKKYSPEELALISNEAKRIKSRKGRFRIISRSVKVGGVPGGYGGTSTKSKNPFRRSGGKDQGPPESKINSKNILPPKGEIVQSPAGEVSTKDPYINSFQDINQSLGKIYDNLLGQRKETQKQEELDRREAQGKERGARESRLEGIFQGLIKTAEVVIKPFRSLFDRVLDYFFNVFLGKTVLGIINWVNDAKNQEKLQSLKRFLVDHGPKLIAAYLLFGTKMGRMVTSLAATLTAQLARIALANPALTAAAVAAAGAVASYKNAERLRNEEARTNPNVVTPQQTAETGRTPGPTQLMRESVYQQGIGAFKFGGIIPKTMNISNLLYKGGGPITDQSGINITGAGADTQLIAAQPGEIIVPKKAVNLYGSEFFMNLIRNSGATGKPKFHKGIQFAQQGGMVGDVKVPEPKFNFGTNLKDQMLNIFGGNKKQSSSDISSSVDNALNNFMGSNKQTQSVTPGTSVDSALNNFISGNSNKKEYKNIPYSLPAQNTQSSGSFGIMNLNTTKVMNMVSPSTPSFISPVPNISSTFKGKSSASSTSYSPKSSPTNIFSNKTTSPNLQSNNYSQNKTQSQISNSSTQSSSQTNITNKFNFAPITLKDVPQPSTSKVSFIDLPPEIINSGQGSKQKNVISNVNVPSFSSHAPSAHRSTNIRIYFS